MAARGIAAAMSAILALGVCADCAQAETGPRFSAPVYFAERFDVAEIVAVDLNADGNSDLAGVAGDSAGSGTVVVRLGRADGSFRREGAYRITAEPADMTSADVNGDGRPDLITAHLHRRRSVTVLLNDGTGRFRVQRVYAARGRATHVAVADVNRDQIVDLVVATFLLDPLSYGRLSVLLGTGEGHFGTPHVFIGRDAFHLAVADVNGDGSPDVVRVTSIGRVVIRLGNGDGTFGPEHVFGPPDLTHRDVTPADFNDDGKLDLVVPLTGPDVSIGLLVGNGDGTFAVPPLYWRSRVPVGDVLVDDFDGDGNLDIVATGDYPAIAVAPGLGAGALGKMQVMPAFFAFDGAVADFNGDSRPDAAFIGLNDRVDQIGSTSTVWQVFLNWSGLSVPPCVVPPIRRERLEAARRDIQRAGCRVGHVRYRYSRKVRRGLVISPETYGAVLTSYARVNVVVSRGRRR